MLIRYLPMSVELTSASGRTHRVSDRAWSFALTMAEEFGWEPGGTHKAATWDDSIAKWQGEYRLRAAQQVTRDDAIAFASALELASLSRDLVLVAQRNVEARNVRLRKRFPHLEFPALPSREIEALRGPLAELGVFAREGAFTIE
jgi:hypothetical protein